MAGMSLVIALFLWRYLNAPRNWTYVVSPISMALWASTWTGVAVLVFIEIWIWYCSRWHSGGRGEEEIGQHEKVD